MCTHESLRGRPVRVVEGNAAGIESRGRQIVELGTMLLGSADIIQNLVEGGCDMEGSAVDKLRERGADVHGELRLAGGLYSGVGPYIRDYGAALADVQAAMRAIVPEAERRWALYRAAEDEASSAASAPVWYPASSGDLAQDEADRRDVDRRHAAEVAEAQSTAAAARRLWEESSEQFDDQYDTWWDEFERAADGVATECSDGIEDSFWDDLDGFVAAAIDVLQVIGIIVAVLALLVGGPIVALIGAVVAIATLALTIYSFARGNSSGWDLAFAIVGVIPFGSIGAIADDGLGAAYKAWAGFGGDGLSFADDAVRWGDALMTGATGGGVRGWVASMRSVPDAGFVEDFVGFTSGINSREWDEFYRGTTSTAQQVWTATDAALSHYNNQYYLPYQIYDFVSDVVTGD